MKKFKFYYQNKLTKDVQHYTSTLDELAHCHNLTINKDWKQIATCEFIGLKDKNGEEVYEGDVIEGYVNEYNLHGPITINNMKLWRFICFWDKKRYSFMLKILLPKSMKHRTGNIKNSFSDYITVIGNIYEDKDLLNEEKYEI
jgi:uncharacterized phage protein (TIGR01671 family)